MRPIIGFGHEAGAEIYGYMSEGGGKETRVTLTLLQAAKLLHNLANALRNALDWEERNRT